ncbi:ATP-dependent nuclease [Pseudomonas thivervalensis]|uniref:ATP-dependent nuclease n=1 Tax=Pseudomonas thivervalensis TaxID=86265 RepID=UPI003D64A526
MTTLKEAKINDYWKDLPRRRYEIALNNLKLIGHDVFEDLQIKLHGGINIFVGRNGVGKSNLVRLIYNCLIAEGSNRAAFDTPMINKAKIELALEVGQKTLVKTVDPTNAAPAEPAPLDATSFMFDPCTLIPLFQQMLLEQSNILELLEQHGQNIASEDDLRTLNYLTGNEYTKVTVTNIEEEFTDYPAFPYFHVESAGVTYSSSAMGMGELSLFYFWWLIGYIDKVEGHKLLIIEEPESFLPPASQDRLANLIAMTCAKQGTSLVLSTHSEHILRRMPTSRMHLVLRTEDGVRTYPVSGGAISHMDSLGLVTPKIGMIFLEDVGGILFAKALFNKAEDFSVDSFYYHKSGSESEITTDLKRLTFPHKGWNFVGLYDGDCRTKQMPTNGEKYFFLPGDKAPDEIMMSYFKSKPSKIIATSLMTSEPRIVQAKIVAAGKDFHDYFHSVSATLGTDFNRLFSSVCEMWIDDNPQLLNTFIKNAKESLQ